MLRELGIAAAQPFEDHRCVFLLFVAIVFEDGAQVGMFGGPGPLIVPVHGLEFFHQRHDGPVLVDDLRPELVGVFVQRFARHASTLQYSGEH